MKYDEVKGKALFTNEVKLSLASEIDMACQYVAVHASGYFDILYQ